MLVVETIARIRREHFDRGKSIKEIARDLKLSRNTVRRILRSGETAFAYEREVQPMPRLGPWREALDRLLAANAVASARERLTLIRVFEELRAQGYAGGYDAVRRYARRWSRDHVSATASAYVPLTFAPGEAYQFDWSHEIVLLNGVTTMVKVAHVRLCHSRMMFVRAYPREAQEMVFDAHERAFAFFKGACRRGIYDNMKTAVETIFIGKDRQYNRRFLQMCSHHLVEPVACTPASGWEKGQVENQVGLVRERFFTLRLRFKSYDELNAWLVDKCLAWAKAHPHPEQPQRTIWEMFEDERPKLIAYRGRFDGFHALTASVSKTCLVRFDNNRYSVNASAVGRPVEIHTYAERLVIRQDGRVVGEHSRKFGREETSYDPWHYVPVLARKPGALRNGVPFKDWVLPAALERVRRKLSGSDDGDRQMVKILAAVQECRAVRERVGLLDTEVECIGKGKAHRPYEFGVKVSVATTLNRSKGGQFIAHVKALPGNPYDGHTLAKVLSEMEAQIGVSLARIVADRGYRGHNARPDQRFKVYISGQRRGVTDAIKRDLRRRSAVEPVIGHAKAEHRMGRNFLKGRHGDAANAILAGASYNFRRLLAYLATLWRVFIAPLLDALPNDTAPTRAA